MIARSSGDAAEFGQFATGPAARAVITTRRARRAAGPATAPHGIVVRQRFHQSLAARPCLRSPRTTPHISPRPRLGEESRGTCAKPHSLRNAVAATRRRDSAPSSQPPIGSSTARLARSTKSAPASAGLSAGRAPLPSEHGQPTASMPVVQKEEGREKCALA
jgi:hypothetical protein